MSEDILYRINKRSGAVEMIYADDLQEFCEAIGTPTVTRASHVEPSVDGKWIADMAPVGGPQLPAAPTRSLALQAEVGWLEAHLFCPRQPAAETAGKEDR